MKGYFLICSCRKKSNSKSLDSSFKIAVPFFMSTKASKLISVIRFLATVQLFTALLITPTIFASSNECIEFYGKSQSHPENTADLESEILIRFKQNSTTSDQARLKELSLKTIGRAPDPLTLFSIEEMSKYTGRSIVTILKYFEFTKKQLPSLEDREILILIRMSHVQKRAMVDVVSMYFEIQQIFKNKWLYKLSIKKISVLEQLSLTEAALSLRVNGSEIVAKFLEIQNQKKSN